MPRRRIKMAKGDVVKKVAAVLKERAKTHGDIHSSFQTIADLWNSYLGVSCIAPKDVSNMMVLLKLSRAKGEFHEDDYVDICGYADIAAELARKEAKESDIKKVKRELREYNKQNRCF